MVQQQIGECGAEVGLTLDSEGNMEEALGVGGSLYLQKVWLGLQFSHSQAKGQKR